jgi:LPXTG-motif cell wall-anchored protein
MIGDGGAGSLSRISGERAGMRAKILGRWVAVAVCGVAALSGEKAAASDYPPDDTTATTTPRGGTTADPEPAGELPATGSDTDMTRRIAGGVIVTGAGLLVAAKRRRRTTAA